MAQRVQDRVDARNMRGNIRPHKPLVSGTGDDLSGPEQGPDHREPWPCPRLSPPPLPVSSCQGQPSQKKRKKKITIWNSAGFFRSISAALKISFVQKTKRKKKSLSSAKIFYLSHMKGYHLLHILKCFKNGYQRVRGTLI